MVSEPRMAPIYYMDKIISTHDGSGKDLQVGDIVLIPAKVINIAATETVGKAVLVCSYLDDDRMVVTYSSAVRKLPLTSIGIVTTGIENLKQVGATAAMQAMQSARRNNGVDLVTSDVNPVKIDVEFEE